MDTELSKKISQKYIRVFREWDEASGKCIPSTDPEYNYYFGIGDGWAPLIEKICQVIIEEFDANPALEDDFYVSQIKEKFGGLRFYTSFVTDRISAVIDECEDASYRTCEHCGKRGITLTNGGWLSTLCLKHHLEHLWSNRHRLLYKLQQTIPLVYKYAVSKLRNNRD